MTTTINEPREIRGYCGHLVGTLTGGILIEVWCHACKQYVGTEWRDGKPVITWTRAFDPKHGGELTVDGWSDGDVLLTITQDGDFTQAVFSAAQWDVLREALDRAGTTESETAS